MIRRHYRWYTAGGMGAPRARVWLCVGVMLAMLILGGWSRPARGNDATGKPDYVTLVQQAVAAAGFGNQSALEKENDGRVSFKSPNATDSRTQNSTFKFALVTIYPSANAASKMFDALAGQNQTDLGNGDKMVIRPTSQGNENAATPGTPPYPYVSGSAYVLCGSTVTTIGFSSYGKSPPPYSNVATYYKDGYAALKPVVQKTIEDATKAVIAAYREAGVCHGGTAPVQPDVPVRIEVVDPNSMFNEGNPIVLNNTDAANNPDKETQATRALSSVLPKRIGAVADGASLLLIRVPFKEKGVVSFTLEGAQAGGTLCALNADPFDKKRILNNRLDDVATFQPKPATGPIQQGAPHWALALYVPPEEFGAEFASKPQREFKIKVSFEGLVTEMGQTPKPPLVSTETIRLVRPPVVLVHGTYDDPVNCWEKGLDYGGYNTLLKDRLKMLGFRVTLLDWRETSGGKNPSSFQHNQRVVWNVPGRGGMLDAVTAMRGEHYACTQSDLVCHSQGGVVARVYIRGLDTEFRRPKSDTHYTNPQKPHDCYYHRTNNFMQGDVNRLLTLSSTHFGSDICRVFNVFMEFLDTPGARVADASTEAMLLFGVHIGAGITDGFWDQVPGSGPLQAIGETVVPAHALACVAEHEELDTIEDGFYQTRLNKIWALSSGDILSKSFTKLGQADNAAQMLTMKKEEDENDHPAISIAMIRAHARRTREAVFGNTRNDCTVREESSHGGLKTPYASTVEHALHGYAPRYKNVQDSVINLLQGTGPNKFDPRGFPAAGQMPENKPARPYTRPDSPVDYVKEPDKPKLKQGQTFTYTDPTTGRVITGIPRMGDLPAGTTLTIDKETGKATINKPGTTRKDPPAAHTGPTVKGPTAKGPTVKGEPTVTRNDPGIKVETPLTGGPFDSDAGDGPQITQVTHDAKGRLSAGGVVRITVRATAKMKVTYDMPPLVREMAIPEIRPGVYQVVYKVKPGDRLENGQIMAFLKAPDGQEDFREADKPINIGTGTTPATNEGTTTGGDNGFSFPPIGDLPDLKPEGDTPTVKHPPNTTKPTDIKPPVVKHNPVKPPPVKPTPVKPKIKKVPPIKRPQPPKSGAAEWVRGDVTITNSQGKTVYAEGMRVEEDRLVYTRVVDGREVTNTLSWTLPPTLLRTGQKVSMNMTGTTEPFPNMGGWFNINCGQGMTGENGAGTSTGWRANSPHTGTTTFTFAPGSDPFIQVSAGHDAGTASWVLVTWKYRKK